MFVLSLPVQPCHILTSPPDMYPSHIKTLSISWQDSSLLFQNTRNLKILEVYLNFFGLIFSVFYSTLRKQTGAKQNLQSPLSIPCVTKCDSSQPKEKMGHPIPTSHNDCRHQGGHLCCPMRLQPGFHYDIVLVQQSQICHSLNKSVGVMVIVGEMGSG